MYKYTKIQGPRFQRNYIIARYQKSDLHGTSFQSSPKVNRILITRLICIPWVPEVFSRVRREFSVLAEGRHVFGRRPKPRAAKPREKTFRAVHCKDLTETGNRARKVSGTQGSERLAGEEGCNSGYCFGASESFVSKISVFSNMMFCWFMS